MVGVGPGRQPHRRMKDVLHAVDYDGPRRIVGEGDDPLDAKQAWPMRAAQQLEKQIEGGGGNRRLGAHAEGADAGVMPVDVHIRMGVVMVVACPVVAVMAFGRGFEALCVQPAADVDGLALRIVKAGVKKCAGLRLALRRIEDLRRD